MCRPLEMGCGVRANRRARSQDGCCSRWTASFPLCRLSFVEFLLYRGKADLTVLDENKNTALHLACSKVLPGGVAVRRWRPGPAEGWACLVGQAAAGVRNGWAAPGGVAPGLAATLPDSSVASHAFTSQVSALCPSPSGP